MQDLTGKDIGRYHIVERLGEGGMATVYKAFDNRLERFVAIKIIRTDMFAPNVLEEVLKRFEREAKALARLAHPHIVKVHDFGDFEDMPYLIMEYLPGGTLKRFTGKPMPYAEAARLLAPIARALEYAHQQNIMHRDIKPANILITQSGQPMLTDFGIAKILEAGESTGLTASGVGIGTPEYMAPEQGMGGIVDARADIYALGVVFYELVTGRRPYSADTPMAVLVKHITEPLPRARQFVSELPEEVEAVIFKALAKQPGERYPDMGALAAALEHMGFASAPTAIRAELPIIPPQPTPAAPLVPTQPVMPESKPSIAEPVAAETVQVTALASEQPSQSAIHSEGIEKTTIQPATGSRPAVKAPVKEQEKQGIAQKKSNPVLWIGLGLVVVLVLAILVGARVLRNIRQARAVPTSTGYEVVVPTKAPTIPATTALTPTQAAPVQAVEVVDCSLKDAFCVGLVTDIGSIEDRSFNQTTWEGVAASKERLGAHVEFLNSKDSISYMTNITKFAEAHYDVIITVGFALSEATTDAARRYPDIKFIGVDQYQTEILPNLAGLVFPEDQAGFLAGALAGLITQTGKVGAVLGTDAVPPVWRYGEGFQAGVKYANPDIEVFVVYHNEVDFGASFTDPDWGATTAQALIIKGADVIFGAGGDTGNGAIISAARQGVFAIGVDTDQYYTIPEVRSKLVTSAIKQLGVSAFELVRLAQVGLFPSGNYIGKSGLAPFHDLDGIVSPEIKAKLLFIGKQLEDGKLRTGVPESKP